jgi:tetratricopeptide (TPR) repeat protein
LIQAWERETTKDDIMWLITAGHFYLTRSLVEQCIGRIDRARRAAVKSIEVCETIVKAGPRDLERVNFLANAQGRMALVEWQGGNPEAALPWVDRAIEQARSILQVDSTNEGYKKAGALSSSLRAEILISLRRFDEALSEWDRAIGFQYEKVSHLLGQRRAVTAAWRDGRAPKLVDLAGYAHAASEADWLVRSYWADGCSLYTWAQVHASCHRATLEDIKVAPDERRANAESYAARAIDRLRRAESAGLFKVPFHRDRFFSDGTFDLLRSRPDFQALLADVKFPADPFAQ